MYHTCRVLDHARQECAGGQPQSVRRRRKCGRWYYYHYAQNGEKWEQKALPSAKGKPAYDAYMKRTLAEKELRIASEFKTSLLDFKDRFDQLAVEKQAFYREIAVKPKNNISDYAPSDTKYPTRRGEWVKFKSEMMIADTLFEFGIPYEYEKPVKLKNGKTVAMDFYIHNNVSGANIYWEHFGRMNDPEYVAEFLWKKRAYAESGIVEGRNFIVTFEYYDYNRPVVELSNNLLREIIQQYFMV